jgi:hypothetical protein
MCVTDSPVLVDRRMGGPFSKSAAQSDDELLDCLWQVEVVLGWCHHQAMQQPWEADEPRLISDEEVQRFRLDKVTPHNAPIALAD